MLLSFFCASFLQAPATETLATRIDEVTVFTEGALVRRVAELSRADGRFTIAGLPAALDAESLRARCDGAQVVGLEARERFQAAVPEARVEELRLRVSELERAMQALEDDHAVLARVGAHLTALLDPSADKELAPKAAGNPEAWRAQREFLSRETTRNAAALRENAVRKEELAAQLGDARLQLDAAHAGDGVHVRDVVVELSGMGAARLELEYVVAGAGWRPNYDLRTSSDASSVELSYRADVWQRSGEDWSDVSLALSTARPQRGAEGPDPEPIWLRFEVAYKSKVSAGLALREQAPAEDEAKDAGRFEAGVEAQGLSVRFRLPARDSIPSRAEPSSVLIGQATLAVTPEYVATPSLDSNVWLRGKAINTSAWTMLPGRAAVYFGADFLGRAELEQVLPGAELTLHLGVDPNLTTERSQLADETSGPGLFGSKATRKQAFRVRLKNTGAAVARADGSALVHVREALPRSTDERITVEIRDSKPPLATGERWKREREELGIVTWAVVVPKSGAQLDYTLEVSYPDGARLLER